MKGYYNDSDKTLYVFPQTADTIPYVDPAAQKIAVQEENINAWKEANTTYEDIIVKYNYNIITVNKKPWSGHTDADIVLPTHNITVTSGSSYIEVAETAAYEDSVTITPKAGYTVDNVNVASSQVEISAGVENWTFTMPDEDVEIVAAEDTHSITLSGSSSDYVALSSATGIAGQTITITPVSPYTVQSVNITSSDVSVTVGTNDWTFTMPDADVTINAALDTHQIELTGDTTYVSISSPYYGYAGETITIEPTTASDFANITLTTSDVSITAGTANWTFTMPDSDVSIAVTYVAPVTTYYADFYNRLEDETPVDYGQVTNDGTVARTETIDGQEIDLTACVITASEYPALIGRTVYGNIDDLQYIGTGTKIPAYVENDNVVVKYGYVIISREPIPHPVSYNFTLSGDTTYVVRSAATATAGTSMTLSPISGYTFNTEGSGYILTASFTGVSATYDSGNDQYTFSMPANDVNAEILADNL